MLTRSSISHKNQTEVHVVVLSFIVDENGIFVIILTLFTIDL